MHKKTFEIDKIPYFRVILTNEGIDTSGQTHAEFGVPLADSSARNGIFASWEWGEGKLTVKNDRYGIYPMFYHCDRNGIIISNSPLKLIEQGVSAELNYDALAVFLRAGIYVGGDTPFLHIHRVPPSATFSWSAVKGLSCDGMIPQSERIDIDKNEAIDRYIELFQTAIRRCLSRIAHPIVLPVSGGQDSRHILFELIRQKAVPECCVTFMFPPPGYIDDHGAAENLCRKLGVKHQVLPWVSNRLQSEKRKNLLTGFLTKEHTQCFAFEEYWDGNPRCVFDGLGGDVLSAATFWTEKEPNQLFSEGRLEELADYLMNPFKSALGPLHEGKVLGLLHSSFHEKCSYDIAKDRIIKELKRHINSHNPLRSFYIANRTTLDSGLYSCCLLPDYVQPYFPYFDADLYDFLTSLPYEMLEDGRFHKEVISTAYPQYAEIPYVKKEKYRNSRQYWLPFYGGQSAEILASKRSRRLLNLRYILTRNMHSLITGTPGNIFNMYVEYLSQIGKLGDLDE